MTSRRRSRRFSRAASATLPRPVLWLLGLGALAAVAAMAWVGFNAPNSIPGRSYYTVQAEFEDANNLTGHYEVRIAGRRVGQVLNPRVVDGKAVVDLQLEPDVAPLRSDTKLRVRPRSAIGVRFVDVSPGVKGRPLEEGDTIAAANTSTVVELDEVLGTLDARRRVDARTVIQELGTGFAGRGEELNEMLDGTPTALDRVARVAGEINARVGAMSGLIDGLAGTLGAIDPARDEYVSAFDSTSRGLRPLAESEQDLGASLDRAPAALSVARAGLRDADPLLDELSGMGRELVPALRPAPAGLRQADALLRESRDGLRAARTTLRQADDAIPVTLDLLKRLDPVIPTTSEALKESLPTLREVGPRGCDIALFTKNWSSMLGPAAAGGDPRLGGVSSLRLLLIASLESVMGTTQRLPTVMSNPYPKPCTVTEDRR